MSRVSTRRGSSRRFRGCVLLMVSAASAGGCERICVNPECPGELRVGEKGEVIAHEQNPGAIPTYLWEVEPSSAGSFTKPDAANTEFLALEEGEVTIRLTASDGLYMFMDECTTMISGRADIAVVFEADPPEPTVGETVSLTCTSVGMTELTEFSIVQPDGDLVELVEVNPGFVRFVAGKAEELTFQCVGRDEGGAESDPAVLTVAVSPSADGNDNDNTSGNENDNDTPDNENGNDNESTNDNTDTTGGNDGA